jgi:hypothetical protein
MATPRHPRTTRDFIDNPPWVTKLLAESMVSLQEEVPPAWLPKLASTQPGRGDRFVGTIAEYGCGAYGCVMPTLDKQVVLKLSSDASEAKFASELADTLPTACVVRYHMLVKLEGAKRDGREVFLLWRESADDVGKIHEVVGMHAEKAIRRQHKAAVEAYMVLVEQGQEGVDEYAKKMEIWKRRCMEMAKVPELEFVAIGMLRAWNERGIFISDTHGGNLGLCVRNGEPTWVITDPGNVVVSTQHADERSRRTRNPVPKKRCERDHAAMKADDAQWEQLDPIGRQKSWDDDDNEIWLDLRNCPCGSTLCRPDKLTPNTSTRTPSGKLKPVWQFVRERLRRRRPDFVDAIARLPDGREVGVEIVDLDPDHRHVTALEYRDGTRHRVPISNIWIDGTKGWNTLEPYEQNPTVPPRGAVRFFEEHAGAAYPVGMRRRDGRRHSARELAIAEYVLEDEHPDAVVEWYVDPDARLHYPDEDVDEYFLASLEEPKGEQLAALGAIGDPDANYRRVIEAELAMEAWTDRVNELAQQLHARRGRPLRLNPEIRPTVLGEIMHYMHRGSAARNAKTLAKSLSYKVRGREGERDPQGWESEVLAHLKYLRGVGLVEPVGPDRERDEVGALTIWQEPPAVVSRAPKWPTDVGGEREANILLGAPDHDAAHQYLHAELLHAFIKSFKDNKHWTMYWEFPGYLQISHPAGTHSIVVAADTRETPSTLHRPWGNAGTSEIMLNLSVVEDHSGNEIAGEDGYYEPWPTSSLEFMAVLQYFLDKYHP